MGHTADALHARREPRFRALVAERLSPSAELVELLRLLRQHGIRRGIASSSDADWVGYLVGGLGLAAEFEAFATGFEVVHRKPAPDLYLLAAERLGVAPDACMALEDSTHGIEAAHAAGMKVIAIPNAVSARQDLSAADARVEHFGEVTLSLLAQLAG